MSQGPLEDMALAAGYSMQHIFAVVCTFRTRLI